jgi:acetolactate synthase-1/2/3 large subunit
MRASTVLTDPAPEQSVSHALVELLLGLGVRSAYGILGGAIAPFGDVLGQSGLRFFAMRHEAGAAFAATEGSLAAGRPTVCVTTTGPGLTNALTGILAARSEGAHVIVISASTAPQKRGRFAVQETSDLGLVTPSALPAAFDLATTLETPEQLVDLAVRLSAGIGRVQGFVAHIALPLSLQRAPFAERLPVPATRPHHPLPEDLDDVVAALAEPFVIWAGFGARHACAEVLELAERTGAPVMLTPRGKGVFPESHPLFLGVTGIGGHDVDVLLRSRPVKRALVLGTRLGEFSSTWDPSLVPSAGLIHVDVDPRAFRASYPAAPTLPVLADVGRLLRAVIPRLPASRTKVEAGSPWAAALVPVQRGLVRPQTLMQALQSVVVDGSDALVFAEPGNSFAWANHLLRFPSPRYRLSGYWASMGHMVTGAVGASLESGRPCVVLTGDGSMLMLSELSSAVQYGARVTWVVLNDARYGMTEAGMQAQGFTPPETRFPRCDFASLARSVGAEGATVEDETRLPQVLRRAMDARGPFVVDVHVDPAERAPFLGRVKALAAMGAR